METNYTPRQVAELLGEPIHSIRNWRRLPADNPRHLPTTPNADGHHQISQSELAHWLRRNPDLAERILSLFAPIAVREALMTASQLRAHAPAEATDPSPDPVADLWQAFGSTYIKPDNNTQTTQGETA
jgi:hypothetical protein